MIYSVIRIFPSVSWTERATKNCLGFRYFITLYLMNPSCIKSQLSECGCITSKTYSFLRLRLKAICCCFSITLKQHLWISLLENIPMISLEKISAFLFVFLFICALIIVIKNSSNIKLYGFVNLNVELVAQLIGYATNFVK